MPGLVPPVADEREGLLAYLAQQRGVLKIAAYGLTDEQARATPAVSALSISGLIKHVASTEQYWMGDILRGERRPARGDANRYLDTFRLGPDETLTTVLEHYDDVARETESIVAGIADLGRPVPVPRDAPWFPRDVDAWSVRWVLLHVIEETARHAGHADIIRESIDGATAFALMAAAEGWEPTSWLKPWQPPVRT